MIKNLDDLLSKIPHKNKYMITTEDILNHIINQDKEIEQLEYQLQQKENIIKEVREEIRMLESNCDISDYQAQKLYQLLEKGE